MRDLVAASLALSGAAAEALERIEEEGLDIVRLKPARFRPLHLFADAIDA